MAGRPEPLLIFIHILKTGGTSLRSILARQYAPQSIITVPGRRDDLASLRELKRDRLAAARVIQGHFPFDVAAATESTTQFVTMLRDPVDRIVSLYYFALEHPERRVHAEWRGYLGSLEEFVSSGAVMEVDNCQTRRISGVSPAFGECTIEMLETAKRNLKDHFAIVGTTESFDASLLLMQRRFGWRDPFYKRQKVTRARPTREAISSRAIEQIRRHNELDAELHCYAGELLEEAIQAQGPAFQAEVRTFDMLNRALANPDQQRRQIKRWRSRGAAPDPVVMLLSAHAACLTRADRADRTARLSAARGAVRAARTLSRNLVDALQETIPAPRPALVAVMLAVGLLLVLFGVVMGAALD